MLYYVKGLLDQLGQVLDSELCNEYMEKYAEVIVESGVDVARASQIYFTLYFKAVQA